MSTGGLPSDEELLAGDLYLERLLAARGAAVPVPPALPPEVAAAARRVRRSLQRFHPSFTFEEALAGRLRAAARGSDLPARGVLVPVPGTPAGGPVADPGVRAAGRAWVLLGGALASALPLAGAALLARRRGRRSSAGIG
ncbi:MAG: hypothetical protein ACKOTZ_09445 [Chloroflexota bacterium]